MAPFLSHVFCNIMGLPNPAAAAEVFPQHKKGKSYMKMLVVCYLQGAALTVRVSLSLSWRRLRGVSGIYASHLLGIAVFSYALMPLTRPSLYGGSVFWP